MDGVGGHQAWDVMKIFRSFNIQQPGRSLSRWPFDGSVVMTLQEAVHFRSTALIPPLRWGETTSMQRREESVARVLIRNMGCECYHYFLNPR